MAGPLDHLRRDESGFSLIELLVALALGSIVLTAVMTVFVNGLTGAGKVTDRVDAGQRARVTADRIGTLLGSQVCGVAGAAPITAATASSITFTANLGTVDALSTRYRIRWDSATKNIIEDRWVATGTDGNGDPVFPTAITNTTVIGAQMLPQDGTNLFTYYGFDTVNGGISGTALTSPVDTNMVIAVNYALTAVPERTKTNDARSTSIQGRSVTGSADPSDPNKGNKC